MSQSQQLTSQIQILKTLYSIVFIHMLDLYRSLIVSGLLSESVMSLIIPILNSQMFIMYSISSIQLTPYGSSNEPLMTLLISKLNSQKIKSPLPEICYESSIAGSLTRYFELEVLKSHCTRV